MTLMPSYWNFYNWWGW